MIRNNKKVMAAIVLAAVAFVTIMIYVLIETRMILPSFVEWNERMLVDEIIGADVSLNNKKVRVSLSGGYEWESPDKFKVSDVMLYDIDHDGNNEMLLLAWKRGKYGKDRPTWIKYDELSWSQHIYLYEISGKQVAPKWMASEIGFDVNGWNCKNGYLILGDRDGNLTYWEWDYWGLEKVIGNVNYDKWNLLMEKGMIKNSDL